MKVKIKKVHPDAKIPYKKHKWDAAYDLYATQVDFSNPKYISYKTGLVFEIPRGYAGFIYPRSSICNQDLSLCNAVGIIDSTFRGEVELRFNRLLMKSITTHTVYSGTDIYEVSDRIGQIIIAPILDITFDEVNELNETSRGNGGFGSTGEN